MPGSPTVCTITKVPLAEGDMKRMFLKESLTSYSKIGLCLVWGLGHPHGLQDLLKSWSTRMAFGEGLRGPCGVSGIKSQCEASTLPDVLQP